MSSQLVNFGEIIKGNLDNVLLQHLFLLLLSHYFSKRFLVTINYFTQTYFHLHTMPPLRFLPNILCFFSHFLLNMQLY